MSANTRDRLLRLARHQMQHGQIDAAIDSLAGALGDDPDNAYAHALLAICLRDRNRLTTAAHEAQIALSLAPHDWFSHLAVGLVAYAQRQPRRAEEHFKNAVELAPGTDWPLRELGRFYLQSGRAREALEWIEAARAVDPSEASNHALLAHWHLEARAPVTAEAHARDALRLEPDDAEALIVLGHAVLQQGRVDEAFEHAAWAVRLAPQDRSALALLVAVKTRRNPLTGLWFRFNTFVAGGSGTRMVLILVGMYLGYRVLSLLLEDLGQPQLALAVNILWLAFCVYTWVAPSLFQRALRKELEQVQLRQDY